MTASNEKQLLPVYLFAGADALKRETLLKRLMKRIEKEGDLTLNSHVFDAAQSKEPTDIIDACNTLPFAAPLRLVMLKNVEKAPKDIADALVAYLTSPSETTILVLEAEKLAKNSRLIKAVQKIDAKAFIDCSERKRSELPGLVQSMARSHGVEIHYDAASKLIELIGTSTIALNNEIEKIAAFAVALEKTTIDRRDVSEVVARSVARSPWDLVDALANRQRGKALLILSELTGESPVSLLTLCIMRIRDLIALKALQRRGIRDTYALAKELGKPDWQIRRLMESSQAYSSEELRTLLARAAETDKKMKSGADAALLLSQFILEA